LIDLARLKSQIVTLEEQQRSATLVIERCEGALQILRIWQAELENRAAAQQAR
jgi:hypothetical protein